MKKYIILCLALIIFGCAPDQNTVELTLDSDDEIVGNSSETNYSEKDDGRLLPEGDWTVGEIIDGKITSIQYTEYSMLGRVDVTISNNDSINEMLEVWNPVKISTEFELQHGSGGEIVDITFTYDNGEIIKITENSNSQEITITSQDNEMIYAVVDLEQREHTIFSSAFISMIGESKLYLNNGIFDVELIPFFVKKDDFVISGKVEMYAYPYSSIEGIDFSDYIIYCNDKKVEKLINEPGEYVLIVENDVGKYQLKYFVE